MDALGAVAGLGGLGSLGAGATGATEMGGKAASGLNPGSIVKAIAKIVLIGVNTFYVIVGLFLLGLFFILKFALPVLVDSLTKELQKVPFGVGAEVDATQTAQLIAQFIDIPSYFCLGLGIGFVVVGLTGSLAGCFNLKILGFIYIIIMAAFLVGFLGATYVYFNSEQIRTDFIKDQLITNLRENFMDFWQLLDEASLQKIDFPKASAIAWNWVHVYFQCMFCPLLSHLLHSLLSTIFYTNWAHVLFPVYVLPSNLL